MGFCLDEDSDRQTPFLFARLTGPSLVLAQREWGGVRVRCPMLKRQSRQLSLIGARVDFRSYLAYTRILDLRPVRGASTETATEGWRFVRLTDR